MKKTIIFISSTKMYYKVLFIKPLTLQSCPVCCVSNATQTTHNTMIYKTL